MIRHDPWAVPDEEKAKRVTPRPRTGEFYQREPVPMPEPVVLVENPGGLNRRQRRALGMHRKFVQPSPASRRKLPSRLMHDIVVDQLRSIANKRAEAAAAAAAEVDREVS